jgi:hypothetical protein
MILYNYELHQCRQKKKKKKIVINYDLSVYVRVSLLLLYRSLIQIKFYVQFIETINFLPYHNYCNHKDFNLNKEHEAIEIFLILIFFIF